MKGIVVRIGYMLLGSLLTICVMLVYDEYIAGRHEEAAIEITTVEEAAASMAEGTVSYDFEAEAEEKLAQLKAEAEQKKQEELKKAEEEAATAEEAEVVEEKTVSANSIEAAPVKWIQDYPKVSSDKTLQEKQQERSSYEETLAVNAFDKKVIENSTIDFSDVKITILGDSLSAGSNLSDEEQDEYSYPAQLKEILGCKEVLNLSVGGSSVSTLGDNAMVERWREIPKDSDIIIVFGGTNDMLFENKWDFGFIEIEKRIKEDTFCGDFDTLVSKIEYRYLEHNKENYCKLLCINPPSNIHADEFFITKPENLIHQSVWAEAINTIAPEYGFEVIDFYNNNLLDTHDAQVVEQFMPDGTHGNAEGYRIIAEHIASQIIQRIEQ